MKLELELLRAALAKDKKRKYKKRKGKKLKKKTIKKPKKKIDVTEGRDLQDCFEELKDLKVRKWILAAHISN